jgi:hypothetical protein
VSRREVAAAANRNRDVVTTGAEHEVVETPRREVKGRMAKDNGWIGVDFDGTLAEYDGWKGAATLGKPIPLMVARVRQWLLEGKKVKIMTARVFPIGTCWYDDLCPDEQSFDAQFALRAIQEWCLLHIGQVLEVTCIKDYGMIELWDDRAVQVVSNTGLRADEQG